MSISSHTYRHPRAFFWLTLCYSLFMASFGGILASLTLYQTQYLHAETTTAYGVFSAAMALLWILPLGGGYLAGKFGYFNAACWGLIFCTFGMVSLCFGNMEWSYIGLALFVTGNGLATPSIWCMVDFCYTKNSPLRESAFTLFYLCFNFGAVLSIFVGGALAEHLSYAVEFGIDAFCLVIAFLVLYYSRHKIVPAEKRSIAPQLKKSAVFLNSYLFLILLITTPIVLLLFKNIIVNNVLMFLLLGSTTALLFYWAYQQPNLLARNRLIAFICLGLISIAFWTLYSLEPSFLSVFIQNNVNTRFLGMSIPASSYFAFDGVFVILFGFILSRVWLFLEKKQKNPSLSFKFSLSLIIIGLGFGFLAFMTYWHGNETLLSSYVVIIAYAIFAFAELLVSPLGISMVGRLAPAGLEGFMMGFWQLSSGIGGVLAGFVASIPNLPDKHLPLAQTNPLYIDVFFYVGLSAFIVGLFTLLFAKKLKQLMEHKARKNH